MNKRIDFSLLDGIGVHQDTFDFMQTSYRGGLEAIARAIGQNVIVTGVEDLGADYSSGWVVIDNELMPFVGGVKAATIMVEEITGDEVFSDDTVKTVYYTKRAKCAALGGTPVGDFTRLTQLKTMSSSLTSLANTVAALAVVPSGLISMWSGAIGSIPAGWALCNGSNGTPDLRGRFIVGYNPSDGDYNAIAKTGGAKSVTLTEMHLPPHTHTIHGETMQKEGNSTQTVKVLDTGTDPNHGDYSEQTGSTGGGVAHENRPPYYTLAYIMKL